MKPPAPVSGDTSSEIARMPCGRMAAMKPPPLAATTLESRIGSPAATGVRTIAPTKSLMASGRSVFLMKLAVAAAAGQVCQPTSPSPTPGRCRGRSWRPAHRRWRAAAAAPPWVPPAAGCRSRVWRRLPPAASATPRTMRRAGFMTLQLPKSGATADTPLVPGISAAKRQGMVNEAYPNRVNYALRPRLRGPEGRRSWPQDASAAVNGRLPPSTRCADRP